MNWSSSSRRLTRKIARDWDVLYGRTLSHSSRSRLWFLRPGSCSSTRRGHLLFAPPSFAPGKLSTMRSESSSFHSGRWCRRRARRCVPLGPNLFFAAPASSLVVGASRSLLRDQSRGAGSQGSRHSQTNTSAPLSGWPVVARRYSNSPPSDLNSCASGGACLFAGPFDFVLVLVSGSAPDLIRLARGPSYILIVSGRGV